MEKDNLFIETADILINSSKITENISDLVGIKVSDILLDTKTSKVIKKEPGKYVTITFNCDKCELEELINQVEETLKSFVKYYKLNRKIKILFVGLGNKNITSDKLGYSVIEKIALSNNSFKIYKEAQGVTNINTVSFVKALSKLLEVDLLIVIDSLKSNNFNRLNKTIQFSTSGIIPGSAFNKKFKETLSSTYLKIPVISIGIPTIIDINSICENNLISKNTLVSTKDIDIHIENLSNILSIAINRTF